MRSDNYACLNGSLHVVHYACMNFRMRCLANRLVEWGFEENVNDLSQEELLILASMMPRNQADKLIELAETRPKWQ